MSRSLKKGPYVDERVLKKVRELKATGKRTPIKTWIRACVISPEMVGYTFSVHNGKNFIEVYIEENMVGRRLGEFSPTRKFVRHGGKIQKEIESGAATSAKASGAPAVAGNGKPTTKK